jgi:uncharacterized membrane protein YgcG
MGALVAGAMGTTPVLADVYERTIVEQLQAEGFSSISTERTWLGRMRIVAESAEGQREIVINPNNGEVLRDLWLAEGGDARPGSTNSGWSGSNRDSGGSGASSAGSGGDYGGGDDGGDDEGPDDLGDGG